MSLHDLIQAARANGASNIADIVAAINRRPTTTQEAPTTVTKPQGRVLLETALRLTLDALDVPQPIPSGTMLALMQQSPWTDAHRNAMALRTELVAVYGLSDADFLAPHFGLASYEATVQIVNEGQSPAHAVLGRDVTYSEIETEIHKQ